MYSKWNVHYNIPGHHMKMSENKAKQTYLKVSVPLFGFLEKCSKFLATRMA